MVGPSVASPHSERFVWFFGRAGQLIFWILGVVLAWYLLGPGAERLHWWWPFERAPRVAVVEAPPRTSPPPGWTAAAKAAMPAVVNVATARTAKMPDDPFFRMFFGRDRLPRREHGLGSGVIVTADGYVLTNNHVVEGAQDIRVTLADRRELTARLVGRDPKTDLAVLKLPGTGYPRAALGDSSRVEVAEVVLALGNPFGLSQTVTMGIVSAVGRANVGIADYEDFIQTDAPINPGNSGGALVDARGALIGINTAIFTQTGGYMGIGFAVPVNMARQVMEQLVRRGRLTRGYLGLAVQEVTPALARGLAISTPRGVVVGDVAPDSPAARAGLQRGDVITAVDGKPVDDVGRFRNLVAGTAPGTTLKLTLLRAGREQTLDVTVGEAPDRAPAVAAEPGASRRPGLSVTDVTPDVAKKLGLPPSLKGALVTEVIPGGPAAEAGLRPGDVIQEVNRKPIRSAEDFAREVEQARGRDVVVLVNRGGSTAYAVIERAG
jgi:serine protease Do